MGSRLKGGVYIMQTCKSYISYQLLCNKLSHTVAAFNSNKHLWSHIMSVALEFGSGLLVVLAQGFSWGCSYNTDWGFSHQKVWLGLEDLLKPVWSRKLLQSFLLEAELRLSPHLYQPDHLPPSSFSLKLPRHVQGEQLGSHPRRPGHPSFLQQLADPAMPVPRLCYYSLPNCQGSEKNDVGMGTLDRQLPAVEKPATKPVFRGLRCPTTGQQRSGQGGRGCSLREKESQRVGRGGGGRESRGRDRGQNMSMSCLSLPLGGTVGRASLLPWEQGTCACSPPPPSLAQARSGHLVRAHQSRWLCWWDDRHSTQSAKSRLLSLPPPGNFINKFLELFQEEFQGFSARVCLCVCVCVCVSVWVFAEAQFYMLPGVQTPKQLLGMDEDSTWQAEGRGRVRLGRIGPGSQPSTVEPLQLAPG